MCWGAMTEKIAGRTGASLTSQNQSVYRKAIVCRLCGSSNLESVLSLNPSPLGDQYLPKGQGASLSNLIPFGINKCNECGNFQTDVAVDAAHYRHCLTRPASVNTILSKSYREFVPKLIELVGLSAQDLVVEIGSNDGLFSSFFAEMGFRCLGIDPALNLVESAERLGVPTIADYFGSHLSREIVNKHGQAKIIVANFIVANVDDIDDFMSGVAELLAPGGVFTMETNYVSDIISNLLVETLVHEHVTYFSAVSLAAFLERHGLELFDVRRMPSKGGSLRCSIQHKGSRFEMRQSVPDAKAYEVSRGLFLPSAWGQLANTFSHARSTAIRYCEQKFNRGIVGYGTSDGATTLIYQLGFGEYLKALIDDDPYRQGLESPGFAIPTVAREEIFTDPVKANCCLVLAPQYINQIIQKNVAARDAGVIFAKVWPVIQEVPSSQWIGDQSWS